MAAVETEEALKQLTTPMVSLGQLAPHPRLALGCLLLEVLEVGAATRLTVAGAALLANEQCLLVQQEAIPALQLLPQEELLLNREGRAVELEGVLPVEEHFWQVAQGGLRWHLLLLQQAPQRAQLTEPLALLALA